MIRKDYIGFYPLDRKRIHVLKQIIRRIMAYFLVKYRSMKHDNRPDGYYIYSKTLQPFKSAYGGKRKRLLGPFKSRKSATLKAGIMALKVKEFVNILTMK